MLKCTFTIVYTSYPGPAVLDLSLTPNRTYLPNLQQPCGREVSWICTALSSESLWDLQVNGPWS